MVGKGSGLDVSKDRYEGEFEPAFCNRSRLKSREEDKGNIMKKKKEQREVRAMPSLLYPRRLPLHRPMRSQADSHHDLLLRPRFDRVQEAFFESD